MNGDGPGALPECDGCGACCKTFRIYVTVADARREPRIEAEGRRIREGSPPEGAWAFQLFPIPFHRTCCFLDDENRCEIYATRPGVCREFAAGSELCRQAREANGLAPLGRANDAVTLRRDCGTPPGENRARAT